MYDNEEHEKLMIKKFMESDGQKIKTNSSNNNGAADDDDNDNDNDDVPLPGFRFHPTDEELVGFYLRRKVERKSISIELIKQIDIYKYDPWDLPKASNVGEKEWYFFCKRGRKYRNSIRPNRVTGSGFWKATGIDRPIYSGGGDCIGLKKSLVYYRGSAGKGTKTDWMLHEFRLPADNEKTTKHVQFKTVTKEAAEVWTLCRILKRNVSYRKCMPEWKDLSGGGGGGGKRMNKLPVESSSSKTCSSFDSTEDSEKYISFNNAAPVLMNMQIRATGNNYMKPYTSIYTAGQVNNTSPSYINSIYQSSHINEQQEEAVAVAAAAADADFFIKQADWDELRSIVEYGGGVISPL